MSRPPDRTLKPHELARRKLYYSARWKRLRAAILKSSPLCWRCRGPATCVDHIEHDALNTRFFDPANVRASCLPCNSHRVAADPKGRSKAGPWIKRAQPGGGAMPGGALAHGAKQPSTTIQPSENYLPTPKITTGRSVLIDGAFNAFKAQQRKD
jgi:hypothetical protein